MAAIARKARFRGLALLLAVLASAPLLADNSAEVHSAIAGVATALSNGEAALALAAFSKSCPDYNKLSDYFEQLSAAYHVESQLEFTDEDVEAANAAASVHWVMTLSTRQSGFTENRDAGIDIKLVHEGKRWRIVSFGPIEFFNPNASK
jgi:hypothetical protein